MGAMTSVHGRLRPRRLPAEGRPGFCSEPVISPAGDFLLANLANSIHFYVTMQ
jgi:hypothetical protein